LKSKQFILILLPVLALFLPRVINYLDLEDQIERIYASHYPLLVRISPDGKKLLLKDYLSNKFLLRTQDTDSNQSTIFNEDVGGQFSPSFSNLGNQLSYFLDSDGKQDYKLVVQDLKTGVAKNISTPRIVSPKCSWSYNDRYLSLLSKEKKIIIIDLHNKGSISFQSKDPISNKAKFTWSPHMNGFAHIIHPNIISIENLDLNTQHKLILPLGQTITDFDWQKLTNKFIVASSREDDSIIEEVDMNSQATLLTTVKGEIQSLYSSSDDSKVLMTTSNGFSNKSIFYTRNSNRSIEIPGNIIAVGSSREEVYIYHSDPKDSRMILVNLTNNSRKTLHEKKSVPNSNFKNEELYINSGSRKIPALLWQSPGKNHPVILMVHGGPKLHYTNSWQPILETFLNNEIDVLLLNYGGSSGFGEKFANESDLAINDISETIAYLSQAKLYRRIFLNGDSYGAGLAINAYELNSNKISGLFITSLDPHSIDKLLPFYNIPSNMLAFQGVNDILCNIDCAEAQLKSLWNIDTATILYPIEHEGHSFYKIRSWAYILHKIIKNVQSN
jgi:dipeptidyl aminopeptidase/acylaminoacyl peptidase